MILTLIQALLALAGLGLIVAGVVVLFGLGWGLIAAGFACLLVVAVVTQGLMHG